MRIQPYLEEKLTRQDKLSDTENRVRLITLHNVLVKGSINANIKYTSKGHRLQSHLYSFNIFFFKNFYSTFTVNQKHEGQII